MTGHPRLGGEKKVKAADRTNRTHPVPGAGNSFRGTKLTPGIPAAGKSLFPHPARHRESTHSIRGEKPRPEVVNKKRHQIHCRGAEKKSMSVS